jgi:hypothetical protein
MTMISDAFTEPKKQKIEPIPTRDTAADAVADEDEQKRRSLLGMGAGSQMLSGPGGVSGELTGTRKLY